MEAGKAARVKGLVRPGCAVAFYMAVEAVAEIEADLLADGVPAECPVYIVASVSTPLERQLRATLGTLSDTVVRERIESPAILLLRYPRSLAAGRGSERETAA